MLEAAAFLVFVVASASIVGSPIALWLLYRRFHRAEERAGRLERRLARIERAPESPRSAAGPAQGAGVDEEPAIELVPEAPEGERPDSLDWPRPAVESEPWADVPTPEAEPRPSPGSETSSAHASAPPAPRPRRAPIEWEQWLGVRGAGLLGGAVAALAAVLLFVHAVQEGWISPEIRVGAGLAFGVGAKLASEVLRRRGFTPAADGLLGAGATAIFAASWAASERYALLPSGVTFALMAASVLWCLGAAWRHRSDAATAIVLIGGFSTPLLVGGPDDRPWSLFGYVALLDLALLALSRRLARRWVLALAFLATSGLQLLWITSRLDPEELGFALLMLGGFGLLFGFALRGRGAALEPLRWLVSAPIPAALVLIALGSFTHASDLNPWMVAGAFTVLQVGARLVAERNREPLLPAITAVGGGVFLAAIAAGIDSGGSALGWGAAAAVAAVGFAPMVAPSALPSVQARLAAVLGVFFAAAFAGLAAANAPGADVLPSFGVALLAVACLARLDLGRYGDLLLAVAFWPLLTTEGVQWSATRVWTDADTRLLTVPLAGVCLFSWLCRRGNVELGRRLAPSVALLACIVLLQASAAFDLRALESAWAPFEGFLYLGLAGPVTIAALVSVARSGRAWVAAPPLFGFGFGALAVFGGWHDPPNLATLAVATLGIAALTLCAPLAFERLRASPVVGVALALSVYVVFGLWIEAFERTDLLDGTTGTLWIAAFVAAQASIPTVALGRAGGARLSPALIGLAAASVLGAGLADAIDLEEGVVVGAVTVGGAALLERWRPHALQRAVGSVVAVTVVLILAWNLFERGHYSAEGAPLFDRASGVHALTTAATAALFTVLARSRVDAPGLFETLVHRGLAAGLALALMPMVWSSLVILQLAADSSATALTPLLEGSDGAGLAVSLAWAVYALALLAAGVARQVGALRWTSLTVLLLTIFKVFLSDLGDLEGLARVGSLAGLAASLIVVSLAYQRFVFRASER